MNAYKSVLIATSIILASAGTGFAQDAMAPMKPGDSMLPDICVTDAGKAAAAAMPMMNMGDTANVDEGHMAMMMGMDAMHKDMMTGTMAEDLDVAFVCGMIPHHMGAITMAKAELKYGKNDWAKQMAQKVIDAQEKEIAEMTDWLKSQTK